jgi:hypothetical protein
MTQASGFTSHPKEGVLRSFTALKNQSSRPRLNPHTLGPKASTLATTLPTRHTTVLITRHRPPALSQMNQVHTVTLCFT